MYGPTLKHQAQFYKRLHNEQRVGNPPQKGGGGGGGGATAATKMTSEFGPSERITISMNGVRYENVSKNDIEEMTGERYKLYGRILKLTIENGVYTVTGIISRNTEYSPGAVEDEVVNIVDEIISGLKQYQPSQQKRRKSSAGGGGK
jgi:hypothetical protein